MLILSIVCALLVGIVAGVVFTSLVSVNKMGDVVDAPTSGGLDYLVAKSTGTSWFVEGQEAKEFAGKTSNEVLDELGKQNWKLVAVEGNGFYFSRPLN